MNGVKKRRKRGLRLFIAYALRTAVIVVTFLCISLMICGFLYIKEHLHKDADDSQYSISDQQEIQSTSSIGNDTTSDNEAIIPIPPVVENNAVVVLDAGHGGIQPGCEFDGILEKDITLSVTLLLKAKLEDMGITVILTRDSDEDISLSERVEIANTANADCFVSIHCNSYTEDTQISGFEGYYYQSDEGKQLADYILEAANSHSINTRNVKEENYQVLREAAIPAVLLEIGYLSNMEEQQNLLNQDYQDIISTTISEGIAAWLKCKSAAKPDV